MSDRARRARLDKNTVSVLGSNSINIYGKRILGLNGDSLVAPKPIKPPTNKPFITEWDTNRASGGASGTTSVRLPLISTGVYDFIVDWGDGTTDHITQWDDPATTHDYGVVVDNAIVEITGIIEGWRFNNGGDRQKIIDVKQWGALLLANDAAFYGCSNLQISANDGLHLGVGDRFRTFRNCNDTTFQMIPGINNWITDGVTGMREFFYNCDNFNQDFTWSVPNLTTVWDMFRNCNVFNGVVDLQDANLLWDHEGMFQNADAFNNRIPHLERPNVGTYFEDFLRDAQAFNHPSASNWITDTWQTVWKFFRNSAFNQPVSTWNTASFTDCEDMFRSTPFNQPLTGWVTNSVFYFVGFLRSCASFNQNIDNLNVEAAFGGFLNMLTNVPLSVANYDALLISWANQDIPDNLTLDANLCQYTAESVPAENPPVTGGDARLLLVTEDLMTFNDAGVAP